MRTEHISGKADAKRMKLWILQLVVPLSQKQPNKKSLTQPPYFIYEDTKMLVIFQESAVMGKAHFCRVFTNSSMILKLLD